MKRSAKFNEKAMKKKLLSQTQSGASVSKLHKCCKLAVKFLCKFVVNFSVMFNKEQGL